MAGLSALSQALSVAKDLREIGRSYDEATFKIRVADIQVALSDAKIALSEANLRIAELEGEISALSDGTLCPVCRSGRLKVRSIEPGMTCEAEFHTVRCHHEGCDYQTTRIYNPTEGTYTSEKKAR
jgi:hypothetical protein